MIKLEMKNYNTILTEKQQKKKQALPSGKIDKCEYLLGEKILPLDQRVFSFRKSF